MNADPSQSAQSQASQSRNVVGVVTIGRNEGDRLKRCLDSVLSFSNQVVYVDSGSSDGSVTMSRDRGVEVVELDLSIPFTAARARNEGFRKLFEMRPDLNYVFFVDGDCEVVEGWLDKACRFLDLHQDVAVVWGRRRERYPDKSIYNMLCDLEWNSYPLGDVKACGGDAVMRVCAFREVNGYRPDLICGEEPELCVRLRQHDWRIWHLDDPMTLHDAAVYRFGQWWRRMLRGGYGFAQGAAMHGAPPERHWVWESRAAWVWGLFFPVTVLALATVTGPWALLLLLVYPAQVVRLALRGTGTARENWWRAGALVLCKFPEMLGQLKFVTDRYRNVQSRLIEYK